MIEEFAPGMETNTQPETFFRLSVQHYHQMVAAGIFHEDDTVELLEGRIINKMPKSRRHVIIANLIIQALRLIIAHTHHIESHEPVTLATSEPEPDVVVLRGQITDYQAHPQANDISLLIEVADSSLQRDQNWKKRLYAEASIPVYWIVNLLDEQIEVYTEPSGWSQHPNYRQLLTYAHGDTVPVVIDGEEIGVLAVSSIFPAEDE